MAEERLVEWKPLDGIPHRLDLEAVHDDYEGLRFLLLGDPRGPVLRLHFEFPIGYRIVNESYRLRTWQAVGGMKTVPTLLTVENSEWLRWLVEEAAGVLKAETLVHYAIYTPDDCVDVVSEFAPKVEWL